MKQRKLCAYCVLIWTLSVISVLGIVTIKLLDSKGIVIPDMLNMGVLSGAGFVTFLSKNPHAG